MHCKKKFTSGRVSRQTLILFFRTIYRFCCDYIIFNNILMTVPRRLKLLKLKVVIVLIILFILLFQIIFMPNVNFLKTHTTPTTLLVINKPDVEKAQRNVSKINIKTLQIPSEAEFRRKLVEKKLEKLAKYSERFKLVSLLSAIDPPVKPTTRVHIFYYTFYVNAEVNGKWTHWNELSNTNSSDESVKTEGQAKNIGSNFFPQLGCYSSNDPHVMKTHLRQIHDAGIGVLVASWTQPGEFLSDLLDNAKIYNIKVALHVQVFKQFSVRRFMNIIQNITLKYTNHPAFYKINKDGKDLPVYYIYEPYHITADTWREVLAKDGSLSIRGTQYDGVFIGLLRDSGHKYHIQKSHFDGFYTYFPSNGYTYGSTWKNWNKLQSFAKAQKLLFFPSVSPGYVDINEKPWNKAMTRHRSRGHYYQVAWRSAIATNSVGLTITSYNDWPHGSQIEPAIPKVTAEFKYLDYEPEGPLLYLNLTRYFIKQLIEQDDKKNDIIY